MFIGSYTRQQPARFNFQQVETDDAPTAYQRVLNLAGQRLVRDAVDTRIISEVQSEGGHQIDSQNQVGGWPVLNSAAPPLDTDQDGMPDQWETGHGLNPADPADGQTITGTGYSNLEVYLNALVSAPDGGIIRLLTTATLQKLGDGTYQATIKVTNSGTGAAQNVWLTSGKLGPSFGTPSPQPLVNIPAGTFVTTTMTFPATAGNSGAGVAEIYTGTYSGGSFAAGIRATLP